MYISLLNGLVDLTNLWSLSLRIIHNEILRNNKYHSVLITSTQMTSHLVDCY